MAHVETERQISFFSFGFARVTEVRQKYSNKKDFICLNQIAQFFLNGSEIQWIQRLQGNWYITEAWIGVNLKILSGTCILLSL